MFQPYKSRKRLTFNLSVAHQLSELGGTKQQMLKTLQSSLSAIVTTMTAEKQQKLSPSKQGR